MSLVIFRCPGCRRQLRLCPSQAKRRRSCGWACPGRAYSKRQLTRRAAKAWTSMGAEERDELTRIARRLEHTDLTLEEYAQATLVDVKLLWRARAAAGLDPQPSLKERAS